MLTCPACRSKRIHRVHARGPFGWLRKKLTRKRPHHCVACGWKGWGHWDSIEMFEARTDEPAVVPGAPRPSEAKPGSASAAAPEPPNEPRPGNQFAWYPPITTTTDQAVVVTNIDAVMPATPVVETVTPAEPSPKPVAHRPVAPVVQITSVERRARRAAGGDHES